jgi:hypothetical protein
MEHIPADDAESGSKNLVENNASNTPILWQKKSQMK